MTEPSEHNTEPSGAPQTERVQQAVEAFVALHTGGAKPELAQFVASYEEVLRPQILSQCQEYLTFDDMLGHQEWSAEAAEEPQGRSFGDFLIQEELGRGGMGVVYLAHQRSLDRRVALKVMTSGLTLSERHVERFRREALATAQLRHPSIVRVYDFVEVGGAYGLAMEYVAGRTLGDVLSDLSLQNPSTESGVAGSLGVAPEKGYVAECAMLAAQVASALAAAHEAKVVHRDLKPRNLMLDDQRHIRLLDFGLAKSLDETRESLSMSGEITGTAHYLSPEQALGGRADRRSDVWSLGVTLYHLISGSPPFEGDSSQKILASVVAREPLPLLHLTAARRLGRLDARLLLGQRAARRRQIGRTRLERGGAARGVVRIVRERSSRRRLALRARRRALRLGLPQLASHRLQLAGVARHRRLRGIRPGNT